jgi:hypothetical protein
VLRRPPACPAGVIATECDFPIKDSVPIIQTDKTLQYRDYRINFHPIIYEYINDIAIRLSNLDP